MSKNFGRPTKYTKEIGTFICETISTTNKSLRTIAKELDINVVTILNWLREHKDFLIQYTQAKEEQADMLAEEIIAIADDSREDTEIRYTASGEPYEVENKEWVNRSRLRVDARKWVAAKLKPKKYGDKIDLTTDGKKIDQVRNFVIKQNDKGNKD